jgi:hypothetical protein
MALTRRSIIGLALLGSSVAHADVETWTAQPASTSSTGAAVRVGVGLADRALVVERSSTTIMMLSRVHVCVLPQLQLELSLGAELGDYGDALVVLASPALAATWLTPLDDSRRLAIRGIVSPAIADRAGTMPTNVSSSLLAHDPLVAWSAGHSASLQISLQGDASVRWGIAASVVHLVPTELPGQQTLVRVDAALAGPIAPRWTWAVEVGVTSDVLDEDYDEGTDVVPLWTAGAYHHRGEHAFGIVTTGGWVGGTRDDLLGPSILFDLRGPL